MKKYILILLMFAALIISGCAGHHDHAMMKKHVNEIENHLNEVDATATHAKSMAEEALMKSKKNRHMMHKMHHGGMMK